MELAELDEVVFGGQGAKRPLAQALPRVVGTSEAGGWNSVSKLKYRHHQVAQLLAQGLPAEEISLITGYDPKYIQNLHCGQEFKELVAYYGTERKRLFDIMLERARSLGITTLEKLGELLESEDEKWTKRELMEMAELSQTILGKGQGQGQGQGQGSGGVVVNVKFVSGQGQSQAEIGSVIEGALSGASSELEWEP